MMMTVQLLALGAADTRPSLMALRGGAEMACEFSLTSPLQGFQKCVEVQPPPTITTSTMIGIGLACTAATMNAAGMNLQRWANAQKSQLLNIVGVIMSASCGILDMASFSFAAQSLLAPFGALTLVINLLLAAPLHGDQVKGHDYVATLLVFGGVAVCLANANTESIERTYSELIALTTRTQFHMWLGLLATGFTVAIAHLRTAPATARSAALCFPLLSGGLGGCTTLCAKTLGELTKAGAPWQSTALVGAGIPCFALSQLALLNAGLARASSLLIVPVFTATFVTCNAVGGGIFFQEFDMLTASQQWAYRLGLAMLVGGVLILASRGEDGKAKSA